MNFLQALGTWALNVCEQLGRASCFLFATLGRRPRFIRTFPLLIQQLYAIGITSTASGN